MIVSAHQPDFLPYSGFFYKLAKSDAMEVKLFDQFLKSGYQRRVTMRDRWCSLPYVKPQHHETPIIDVPIRCDEAKRELAKFVHHTYVHAPLYREVREWFYPTLEAIDAEWLWEFNVALIYAVRDYLGIKTPLHFGGPQQARRVDGLIELFLRDYGRGTTYLSGPGARSYMGEGREFADAGIELQFTNHRPVTGDSIMSVLMDHPDPLAVVMEEGS
jgi:hypothetical protein